MPAQRSRMPAPLKAFRAAYPRVWRGYEALRDAGDTSGPLTPKIRELIKIGIEVARRRQGGLIAHIKRARRAGATAQEIHHAIALAIPLIGLPDVLDAFLIAKKHLK